MSRLETQGSTALGPALALSVGIASSLKGGTEIVLCTDGLVGLSRRLHDGLALEAFHMLLE